MAEGKYAKLETSYGLPDCFDVGEIVFYSVNAYFYMQLQPRVA